MSIVRGPLLVLHAIFATVILIALAGKLASRQHDLASLRLLAGQEHREVERLAHANDQVRSLVEGIAHKDPYVVELEARDKLHYSAPGDIAPPPLPSIDNAQARDNN
jgi:cell division protein FtsB